jgi:hypothetical protein
MGAAFRPPRAGETNETAPDGKVSTVADAGCMLHVHEIDTPTLDPELTQSCRRVAPVADTLEPVAPQRFARPRRRAVKSSTEAVRIVPQSCVNRLTNIDVNFASTVPTHNSAMGSFDRLLTVQDLADYLEVPVATV